MPRDRSTRRVRSLHPHRLGLLGFFAALLLVACDPAPASPTGPVALLDLDVPRRGTGAVRPSGTDDFYALPFPNDLRIGTDGTVDLSRYPRSGGALSTWVDALHGGLRGFGLYSAIYLRFDAPLDPGTLPATPDASLAADAGAFVVDVTPASPTFGRPAPIVARFTAAGYDHIGPNHVDLLPAAGFPLRARTTYAAILTDRLAVPDGQPASPAPRLAALLADAPPADDPSPALAAARAVYAPLRVFLASRPELRARMVSATVFTTADPIAPMRDLRDAALAVMPPPTVDDLAFVGEDTPSDTFLYAGTFRSPNFQSGDRPTPRPAAAASSVTPTVALACSGWSRCASR